jgi:hypothetical protein
MIFWFLDFPAGMGVMVNCIIWEDDSRNFLNSGEIEAGNEN